MSFFELLLVRISVLTGHVICDGEPNPSGHVNILTSHQHLKIPPPTTTSIMPTPQELRERRQAKIKAGGADRLSRITKTALPEDGRADYKGMKIGINGVSQRLT